jgi:hypothetical protein
MSRSRNRSFWRRVAVPVLTLLTASTSRGQVTVHATARIEHTWKKGEYTTSGVEAGEYSEQTGERTGVIQLEPAKAPAFPSQMVCGYRKFHGPGEPITSAHLLHNVKQPLRPFPCAS